MKYLDSWFVQLDPTDEHDPTNYFSSKPSYSSEIYARINMNDIAQVAYIPLVLTDADHQKIHQLEEDERKAKDDYFQRQEQPKKHWWQKAVSIITDADEFRRICKRYDDTELVYKPRHSKELHDAHLHLVLSTPYMYKILHKYQETGQIDKAEVDKALNIAQGIETPHIVQIPKWRQPTTP